MQKVFLLIPALAILCSCGNSNEPATPTGPTTFRIQVAGNYSLVRTYHLNNCDPKIPGADLPVTGVVDQPTEGHFTLRNADTGVFNAPLQLDGSFDSGRQRFIGTDRVPYDLLFKGGFSTTGFTATVTVDLFRAGGTCRSMLDWQATKQGSPNLIP
jgi:hypothetical protein